MPIELKWFTGACLSDIQKFKCYVVRNFRYSHSSVLYIKYCQLLFKQNLYYTFHASLVYVNGYCISYQRQIIVLKNDKSLGSKFCYAQVSFIVFQVE